MNAQSVAQIARTHESLWEFLVELPTSMEAEIGYALIIAGILGMFFSWLIKWARGQAGALHVYLFTDQVKLTVLAASAYVGVCTTAVTAGIFVTSSGEFVGWANVLWFGLTNAFGIDAAANKGGSTSGSTQQPKQGGTP